MVDVGETFYRRHTAQHQLQWSQIKMWEMRSFKSNENIQVALYIFY